MHWTRIVCTLAFAAPVLFLSTVVGASPVFVDDFLVVRNGFTIFHDRFDDGVPPPSAPPFPNGNRAFYFANGTQNEAGGKLRLDTEGAGVFLGLSQPIRFHVENALLATDISTNLQNGLKIDDTFSVGAIFDLTVPGEPNELYGIRLTDRLGPSTGNDVVSLFIRQLADGTDVIQFGTTDATARSFTQLGAAVLDPSHDQICLDLSRLSLLNNQITASFCYVDDGIAGPMTTFGATGQIFRGEVFTRAEFMRASPVATPASLLLVVPGLIWGFLIRRGRGRR